MHFLRPISRLLSQVTTPLSLRRALGCEALLLLLLASCSSDLPESGGMGRIVLSLDGNGLYTELETRATQPLTDLTGYVFTLSGTTAGGEAVAAQQVTLTRVGETNTFAAVVEAGTYHLTADNYAAAASTAQGCPYYSGSSDDFTVAPATTVPVSIALGTPKNAAVTYLLDDSFTALYNNPTITIDVDGHDILLTAPAATATSLTNAVYCHVAATPATQTVYNSSTARTLTYTLSAAALPGSYVTDITAATGTLTVASDRHTILTLSANPTTGEIIPIATGEHGGEFD